MNSVSRRTPKETWRKAAEAWRELLQGKQASVVETELQAKAAEGDAKTPLLEKSQQLREERTTLSDRLNAVLAAWTAKGATPEDIAEYETYYQRHFRHLVGPRRPERRLGRDHRLTDISRRRSPLGEEHRVLHRYADGLQVSREPLWRPHAQDALDVQG